MVKKKKFGNKKIFQGKFHANFSLLPTPDPIEKTSMIYATIGPNSTIYVSEQNETHSKIREWTPFKGKIFFFPIILE
jgi:hypothetical protein